MLAALVASIVLSLGTAIYSIAIKQVRLSSLGRDSQFAFYAADTIAECVLHNDIRLNKFPQETPDGGAISFTCNGKTYTATADVNSDPGSSANCSYWIAGGEQQTDCGAASPGSDANTFVVPAYTDNLSVVVSGGGGGGGGGARCSIANGQHGSDGSESSFGSLVEASGGEGGNRGLAFACTSQQSDGDGGTGPNGGGPGRNSNGRYRPGRGGAGYVESNDFPEGTVPASVSITVGAGGNGGNAGGTGAIAGDPGSSGTVQISWGTAPDWESTTFTFEPDDATAPNCATGYILKTLTGANYVETTIHVDGENVSCDQNAYDPHALQRSVELSY